MFRLLSSFPYGYDPEQQNAPARADQHQPQRAKVADFYPAHSDDQSGSSASAKHVFDQALHGIADQDAVIAKEAVDAFDVMLGHTRESAADLGESMRITLSAATATADKVLLWLRRK